MKDTMVENKIDFVILWVDGNDPAWISEKKMYEAGVQDDDRGQRYRNWDNLQYWFRGVEKYAPWVNKIFFITCGHIPEWLNINHPKLKIVRHEEYISPKYLPLFNSNPIELMVNRIRDLSEHFVLFNDDMFLIRETDRKDFFRNGLPCDSAALNIHSIVLGKTDHYASLQAMGIVNKYFDMHKVISKNLKLWLSPKYGTLLFRTLYLLPCPVFPEIRQIHLPYSYLKSTFDTVWEKEFDLLSDTCTHRFRNRLDYSHWTMRNWQIASGSFAPRNWKMGKSFAIENDTSSLEACLKYIRNGKGKVVCINDGELTDEQFLYCKDSIINEFETLLPEKSKFEI
jgi:hypothetical protein